MCQRLPRKWGKKKVVKIEGVFNFKNSSVNLLWFHEKLMPGRAWQVRVMNFAVPLEMLLWRPWMLFCPGDTRLSRGSQRLPAAGVPSRGAGGADPVVAAAPSRSTGVPSHLLGAVLV